MKKRRIIGVILLKNGWLVQSLKFEKFLNLGNPVAAVKRFAEWDADELIYLDISRDGHYDLNRDDIKQANRVSALDILEDVGRVSHMPLTFGGKIRTIADVDDRMRRGCDKVSVNKLLHLPGDTIRRVLEKYGAQSIVASVDVKSVKGGWEVFLDFGRTSTQMKIEHMVDKCNSLGVGEILVNSIDRDGTKSGFDIELYKRICSLTNLPVIACGGAGDWETFEEVLRETEVDGVAGANVFQHIDQSMYLVRKWLFDRKYNVRAPRVMKF